MGSTVYCLNYLQERSEVLEEIRLCREQGRRIIFTNGCFDIIHLGHIYYLREAKALGGLLLVGLNSDRSVARLKGRNRPINDERARAGILSSLKMVDFVVIFDEDTPLKLIEEVRPDVLVKGGDWKQSEIIGADFVASYGGDIKIISYISEYSTTKIISKIIDKFCRDN